MTPQQPATFGRRGLARTAPRRTAPVPVPSPGPRLAAPEDLAPALTYDALLHDDRREDADEARMRRFIGPNWPDFEGLWRDTRTGDRLIPSFSGAAFSFSIAWLIYRRLYTAAAVAVAVEICITRLSPVSSTLVDLLLCLAIGAFGKALVVRKGLRTIGAIAGEGLPHGVAAARIERRGGVRLAEALAGSILLAGFSAASLYRMIPADMAAEGTIRLDGLQELLKVL